MEYRPLPVAVRSVAAPTTSYVAGDTIDDAYRFNQCDLHVAIVLGTATSVEVKVEFTIDGGTTYVPVTNASISGGTTTVTPGIYSTTTTGNHLISVPISAQKIKVSTKGTGTLTTTTVGITAVLSYV